MVRLTNSFAALRNSGSFCRPSKCRKSGQMLLSHTIFFLFSIAMILAIVVAFGTIRKDAQDFVGNNEMQQVCAIIRTAVDKLYLPGEYASPSNATMGRITVSLPERVGDASYRARFVDTSIVIETSEPKLNRTCETGFNANFTGSTSGGRTQFEWTRYSTGSNVITMTRVLR